MSGFLKKARAVVAHIAKWDEGAFAELANRGHIRELNAANVVLPWQPAHPGAHPPTAPVLNGCAVNWLFGHFLQIASGYQSLSEGYEPDGTRREVNDLRTIIEEIIAGSVTLRGLAVARAGEVPYFNLFQAWRENPAIRDAWHFHVLNDAIGMLMDWLESYELSELHLPGNDP